MIPPPCPPPGAQESNLLQQYRPDRRAALTASRKPRLDSPHAEISGSSRLRIGRSYWKPLLLLEDFAQRVEHGNVGQIEIDRRDRDVVVEHRADIAARLGSARSAAWPAPVIGPAARVGLL